MTELRFFRVEGVHYGGSQDWNRNWLMRVGGCSTATACDLAICMAQTGHAAHLCPFDPDTATKDQYRSFFSTMFQFVRPGIGGLTSLRVYAAGVERYAASCGVPVTTDKLHGRADWTEADDFITAHIDQGVPVSYLMLHHVDSRFEDFEWHWFTVTGYEHCRGKTWLSAATYGQRHILDLRGAWETGYHWKGGLVSMRPFASTHDPAARIVR